MAVPAHDTRDYEFAKKFGLDIIPVLEGGNIEEAAWTEDGLHINSEFLNGMNKEDAINTMLKWLRSIIAAMPKQPINCETGCFHVSVIGGNQFLSY